MAPDRPAPAGRLDGVPAASLPMALAELHGRLPVGRRVHLRLPAGPGLPPEDLLEGAGFAVLTVRCRDDHVDLGVERLRTLADTVAPGMRLLVVGLNPSLYAADAEVAFARPGNRFWPAALAAGLVSRDRDPAHALRAHGVGLTDLVKRATVGAAHLIPAEYRRGMDRVARLVAWSGPGLVCLVGLAGWRAVVGPTARAGLQPQLVGGRPCYVMPSTSGANAHARPGDLADHLRTAAGLADGG